MSPSLVGSQETMDKYQIELTVDGVPVEKAKLVVDAIARELDDVSYSFTTDDADPPHVSVGCSGGTHLDELNGDFIKELRRGIWTTLSRYAPIKVLFFHVEDEPDDLYISEEGDYADFQEELRKEVQATRADGDAAVLLLEYLICTINDQELAGHFAHQKLIEIDTLLKAEPKKETT